MKSLILLSTLLLTACGYEKEKDKDGVAPRLVSLNVEHEPEQNAYFIVLEGRVSTETVDQFIAYEISASISEDEMPDSCITGDDVYTFYQQERIEVEPESKYYIVACSVNKENGSISETMSKTVRTKELEPSDEEYMEPEPNPGKDPNDPLCVQEPNHVLCHESANICDQDPTLCLVTP